MLSVALAKSKYPFAIFRIIYYNYQNFFLILVLTKGIYSDIINLPKELFWQKGGKAQCAILPKLHMLFLGGLKHET